MSAKSKHYGDVADWIVEIINSCNHPLQEIVAKKLVRQFRVRYCEIDFDTFLSINRRLQNTLDAKVYGRKATSGSDELDLNF
jgi:hypothetical protein